MKKLILSLVLVAFIMLGTSSVAHATVRFYFYITLYDSCGGAYNGYYDVQVKVTANGLPIGIATCTTVLKGGPTCYPFDFDIQSGASDGIYGIIVVGVQRHGGTCQTQLNASMGGGWYWSDFLSCSGAHGFTVIVQ
jgi:hypothetical protein